MNFPAEYFEDEVRDGFYIPAKMKRYWAAQLEVLSQIDEICERHGLKYFAHYGTLLGAIRHGGFIPWDDDLDICMKRADLTEFIKYAKNELPEGAFVLTYEEEQYSNLLVRVVNSRGLRFDRDFLEKYHGSPYVLGIDIFVLDNLAPTPEADKKQCDAIKAAFKLAETAERILALQKEIKDNCELTEYGKNEALAKCTEQLNDIENEAQELESGIGIEADRFGGFSVIKRLRLIGESYMMLYDNEKSERVTDFGNRVGSGRHDWPSYYFDKAVRIPFECTNISVSPYYDSMLAANYGNYMKVVKGTAGHGYPVYSIQDETIERVKGRRWMEPYFPGDFPFIDATRRPAQNRLYSSCKEMTDMLEAAINMLPAVIDGEHPEEAFTLLEKASDLAQQLGERLEKAYSAPGAIPVLENYCERLYKLYGILTGEDEDEQFDFGVWSRECLDICAAVASALEGINGRLRVVILVRKKTQLDAINFLLANFGSSEEADLYVVPVPYASIDCIGEPEGEYVCSEDLLASELNCLPVAVGDLLPDIIITTEAFDSENIGYRVRSDFYVSELVYQAPCVVTVPGYVMDDITNDRDISMITLRYLCNTPGALYSDFILAETDNLKGRFIQTLTDYSGESFANVWQGKVRTVSEFMSNFENVGSAASINPANEFANEFANDSANNSANNSDDNLAGNNRYLCIHIGLATLLQNRAIIGSKLKSVIEILSAQSKIKVLWVRDEPGDEFLGSECGAQAAEYEQILAELERQGIGRLGGESEALKLCCAYYGDGCRLMKDFVRAGKPVMVINPECL